LFSDTPTDVDLSALPNSSAAVAGTPVSQLSAPRTTPAARASVVPTTAGASTPSAPAPPAPPTLPPEPTAAAPSATPVLGNTVLDERFESNARNWPSNAQGTAVLTTGSYRIIPRSAGQFV